MKRIRFTRHALEQCGERGAAKAEVIDTITTGKCEPGKKDRLIFRANFQYNALWGGQHYSIKQVAAVTAEYDNEIVVITVYTFYF
jgi:hypothetical protein